MVQELKNALEQITNVNLNSKFKFEFKIDKKSLFEEISKLEEEKNEIIEEYKLYNFNYCIFNLKKIIIHFETKIQFESKSEYRF